MPTIPPSAPPTVTLENPLVYPRALDELTFHPSICAIVDQYAQRGEIMHTLFYGPASSGKTTLARRLINVHTQHAPTTLLRRTHHTYRVKDRFFPFYKTSVHFEIDVADFSPHHQKALIELLQELARTLNVSRNAYKLLLLKNTDLLSRAIQHQLRRMMELFYSTCRLVFLSHSLDRIDPTLLSRFVCVRVPRPRLDCLTTTADDVPRFTVQEWVRQQADGANITSIVDTAVEQLWRALLRKVFAPSSVRKWVRIITLTKLPHVHIVHRLVQKCIARYPKTRKQHVHLLSVVNYYLHLHAHGMRKEFQIETLLVLMHARLHQPAVFEAARQRVLLEVV